jgi:hypothetical protein
MKLLDVQSKPNETAHSVAVYVFVGHVSQLAFLENAWHFVATSVTR